MDDPKNFPQQVIQIIGNAGIGKTSTVLRFAEFLQKEAKKFKCELLPSYVNLKLQGGKKHTIFKHLLDLLAPEIPSQGLSAEEMLKALMRYLREQKKYSIVIMDEIDYLVGRTDDTSIIYDLTRLNEIEPGKSCNILGVIFIARSKNFHKKLDAGELSSLGRFPIIFHQYNVEQISDILNRRSDEAFNLGVVDEEVIDYVADVTYPHPVNSDIRYALDLLFFAGNLAENQSNNKVLPEHVRKIHSEMHPSITSEDIMNLTKREHLIALLAVAKALKTRNRTYVDLKELRNYCGMICEQLGLKQFSNFEDYLQDLCDRGIIEIHSLREIGISGAAVEDLGGFVDALIKRVSNGLGERRKP